MINDGKVNVWDVIGEKVVKIQEYEIGSVGFGSFGMCVDFSRDGKYIVSGYQNGVVYIFDNDIGRILFLLLGIYCLCFYFYINIGLINVLGFVKFV